MSIRAANLLQFFNHVLSYPWTYLDLQSSAVSFEETAGTVPVSCVATLFSAFLTPSHLHLIYLFIRDSWSSKIKEMFPGVRCMDDG